MGVVSPSSACCWPTRWPTCWPTLPTRKEQPADDPWSCCRSGPSILVRVAAWIVLLQSGGLINGALLKLGLIDQPLQLVFNRTGVYIAMAAHHHAAVHDPADLQRDERGISPSSCAPRFPWLHPFASFWRVYSTDRRGGVGAGCPAGVHPVHRLLHHPEAAGQPERPDGQLLRRLLYPTAPSTGHGHRPRRPAPARHPWCSTSSTAGWWAPAACAWDRGPSEKANRFPCLRKRLPEGGRGDPHETHWRASHAESLHVPGRAPVVLLPCASSAAWYCCFWYFAGAGHRAAVVQLPAPSCSSTRLQGFSCAGTPTSSSPPSGCAR